MRGTLLVQHLLVFFLVVVIPLWDWFEVPRLKASTAPRKKIGFYQKTVAASWACALVAVVTIGPRAAATIDRGARAAGWFAPGTPGGVFLEGLIVGMLIVIILPAVLAMRSDKIRIKAGKAARRLAFILPSTGEERRWWWLVSITAGICEELVYRGFLLHYLHVMPFHLDITRALVGSSLIFGIGHIYQGIAGAVQTTVIGFVLGAMFLLTGNLLLPIVVHAVIDLRVLTLLPAGFGSVEGA
jgi:uncharacterized protein